MLPHFSFSYLSECAIIETKFNRQESERLYLGFISHTEVKWYSEYSPNESHNHWMMWLIKRYNGGSMHKINKYANYTIMVFVKQFAIANLWAHSNFTGSQYPLNISNSNLIRLIFFFCFQCFWCNNKFCFCDLLQISQLFHFKWFEIEIKFSHRLPMYLQNNGNVIFNDYTKNGRKLNSSNSVLFTNLNKNKFF